MATNNKPMFWQLIGKGFSILLEWKVWVVVFFYSVIMLAMYARFEREALGDYYTERFEGFFARAKSYAITRIIVDSVLTVLCIFLIMPMLLGGKSWASFSDLKYSISPILFAMVVTIGLRVVFSQLGGISESIPKSGSSFSTILTCIFIVIFFCKRVTAELKIYDGVFPNFWMGALMFIIGWAALIVFVFVFSILIQSLKEETGKYISKIVGAAASLWAGIIFMRMYCYYVIEKLVDLGIGTDTIQG